MGTGESINCVSLDGCSGGIFSGIESSSYQNIFRKGTKNSDENFCNCSQFFELLVPMSMCLAVLRVSGHRAGK